MLLRLVCVVRTAAKLDIRNGSLPTIGERDDVVKLEEACLTAPTVRPVKCTPPAIPLPDFAPDRRRNAA